MIKKLIRIITNPHGLLIKVIIDLLSKQFGLDRLPSALKYVEEDNVLDKGLRELKDEHEAMKNVVMEISKEQHTTQPLDDRLQKVEEFQKKMANLSSVKKILSRG